MRHVPAIRKIAKEMRREQRRLKREELVAARNSISSISKSVGTHARSLPVFEVFLHYIKFHRGNLGYLIT